MTPYLVRAIRPAAAPAGFCRRALAAPAPAPARAALRARRRDRHAERQTRDDRRNLCRSRPTSLLTMPPCHFAHHSSHVPLPLLRACTDRAPSSVDISPSSLLTRRHSRRPYPFCIAFRIQSMFARSIFRCRLELARRPRRSAAPARFAACVRCPRRAREHAAAAARRPRPPPPHRARIIVVGAARHRRRGVRCAAGVPSAVRSAAPRRRGGRGRQHRRRGQLPDSVASSGRMRPAGADA